MFQEKINIYVSREINNIIESDARYFEIFKNDCQKINKNLFLSLLLNGYYKTYIQEYYTYKEIISDRLSTLISDKQEIEDVSIKLIEDIILPIAPKRKGKQSVNISLKPTKNNEDALIALDSEFNSYGKSTYLNWIITTYCKKPIYERERIIFKNNYQTLKKAIDNNLAVSFRTTWNKNLIHTIMPFKLLPSDEEMFNYIVCAEYKEIDGSIKQQVSSYRLNRITNLTITDKHFNIEEDVKRNLSKTVEYDPKFAINEAIHAKIKLTQKGIINFNRIYQGKPKKGEIKKINDLYCYYFDGSIEQLFLYLKKFENDIEVIEPKVLKDKLYKFHNDYVKSQRKDDNHE